MRSFLVLFSISVSLCSRSPFFSSLSLFRQNPPSLAGGAVQDTTCQCVSAPSLPPLNSWAEAIWNFQCPKLTLPSSASRLPPFPSLEVLSSAPKSTSDGRYFAVYCIYSRTRKVFHPPLSLSSGVPHLAEGVSHGRTVEATPTTLLFSSCPAFFVLAVFGSKWRLPRPHQKHSTLFGSHDAFLATCIFFHPHSVLI